MGIKEFLTGAIDSLIPYQKHSETTSAIINDIVYPNLKRLGIYLPLKMATDYLYEAYPDSVEINGISQALTLATCAVYLYDCYNNELLRLALAKTFSREESEELNCGCSEEARVQGVVRQAKRNFDKWILVESLRYYQASFAVVPEAVCIGASLYANKFLHMCDRHMLEKVNSSNYYCAGVGAAFIAARSMCVFAIKTLTGVDDFYTLQLLESILYAHFILSVMSARTCTFKNSKAIDVFYYYHKLMSKSIKKISDFIDSNPESDNAKSMLELKDFIAKKEWLKVLLNKIVLNSAHKHFINAYHEDIVGFLERLLVFQKAGRSGHVFKDIRAVVAAIFLPYIPNFITECFLSNFSKDAIKVLFTDDMVLLVEKACAKAINLHEIHSQDEHFVYEEIRINELWFEEIDNSLMILNKDEQGGINLLDEKDFDEEEKIRDENFSNEVFASANSALANFSTFSHPVGVLDEEKKQEQDEDLNLLSCVETDYFYSASFSQ